MQQHEEVAGTWPLLSNDVHYIDCKVVAGDRVYDHEFTSNPALVYHFNSLNKPAVSQKEIMKKYSQVNAKRNILFHGGKGEISIDDVEKAFKSIHG